MVAVLILTVITGVVYATFSSVVDSSESARIQAEELRFRQFLTRQLTFNLQQAVEGWRPGALAREQRTPDDVALGEQTQEAAPMYWLQGTDESGANGPADTLSFSTSAPLLGNTALPGFLKQVELKVVAGGSDEDALQIGGDAAAEGAIAYPTLEWTEIPLMTAVEDPSLTTNTRLTGARDTRALEQTAEEVEYKPIGWSYPVRSLDIQYFDGKDWVDEWDTLTEERLPWSIRFRINFARTAEELRAEQAAGLNPIDDPDFELIVTLPGGAGTTSPPPAYDRGIIRDDTDDRGD